MGVVYEATQETPRRRVALKVVRLGLAGESSTRRFRHEAARTIRETAPARPGVLDTRLRGDLETILLKALEEAARVLERFFEVAQSYADRATEDAFAQRQMLLVDDRIGIVQQRFGEDESLSLETRIAGDEAAAPSVEQAGLACEEARELLEVELAQ